MQIVIKEFSPPDIGQFLAGALVPFIGEWVLEIMDWVLGVVIGSDVAASSSSHLAEQGTLCSL